MARKGEQLFLGWDVGGWNCSRNQRSRDALVITEESLNLAEP